MAPATLISFYLPLAPKRQLVFDNNVNLVGVPRIVKDNCAQLHNCTHDWSKLNARAFTLLNTLANHRLQHMLIDVLIQLP